MTDFLARENEILGGEFSSALGSGGAADLDFDRAASAFPDISLDGTTDIPAFSQPPLQKSSSGFDFDDFPSPPPPTDVKITGDDELELFENQFPDIDVPSDSPLPPVATSQQHSFTAPAFSAAPTFAPRPQPSALTSTPIFAQTLEEDEPQVIKAWREKRDADIKARDAASKTRRQETITKAERAIDSFYEEYANKKERNIRENKERETEFLRTLSESLSSGTTWSRICDLVDLQNSQSKTLARTGPDTTDITRFKEVLLRLKREGEAAPGAAGY